MTNNKPNTQVALDFITKMFGNKKEALAEFIIANLDGSEQSYKSLVELVESLAQENYENGQNIAIYHGSGAQVYQDHRHSPFGFSKFAAVDWYDMSYFAVGICYRNVPDTDAETAKQIALQLAYKLSLKPTAIVDSGVSIQLYWQFDKSYRLFYKYESEDKIRFAGSSLFCSQLEALWSVINVHANKMGLTLENSATTIGWKDGRGVCNVNLYSLLPGLIHRYYNQDTHQFEEFMVKVIELTERHYRYEDIMVWIDEWNKENLQVLTSAKTIEEYRELYINQYIENKIFYNTLIDLFPRAWQIPYARVGTEIYNYEEEVLEWLQREKEGDIEEDIEEEWVLEVEIGEAQQIEA